MIQKHLNMKKIITFSFAALALSFMLISATTSNNPSPVGGVDVGDEAPGFNLKNIDGKMVSLKDQMGEKGAIIIFTCNHCPYAVMYEDRIIDLHNTYAAKGYPVIAINPNDPDVQPEDSFEKMQVRAEEKGFPFVYLFDDGQEVYPAYGAKRTPHVFLLDNTQKVRYIGAIDNNPQEPENVTEKYLENAIAALESGNNPDPDNTKAIGCSIKYKK
jgi:peroxiredoxin